MRELSKKDFQHAIVGHDRKRIMRGEIRPGDVRKIRMFLWMTQLQFAKAMGISVHTLRNWEQGRRHPEGSAIALLRIAARHPNIMREQLKRAA